MTGSVDYRVGDALSVLSEINADSAAVVALDDAWARPKRLGHLGVEYPTHGFERTAEIVAACRRVLKPGGWLIATADDWLLPKLVTHLQSEWGNVAETYRGGGYRRIGGVTYVTKDGEPYRRMGEYLTNGGYPVVFAHEGETDRRTSTSARQIARKPSDGYGWGSVKPVEPYKAWIDGLTAPGELVVEPCAGTAPASIGAAELGLEAVAIDCEQGAKDAHERRKADHNPMTQQELPV